MNIQTIKYISMIAGTAADRVKAGKTLKSAKAWLVEAMSETNTPFVHVDGVDFEEVNKRVNLLNAVNINTKGGFVRQLETAVARMAEQHDNVVFANRVQYAIDSAAKRHGVVIHAADVIEWANGDIHFNFTKAADALAEAAKEAEQAAAPATVETIAEAAGLFDLWELLDRSPLKMNIDNLEMHYCEARNDELAGGDAATAPQRLFGFNPGDTLAYVFNAVCNQAREDLQIHIEASHDEALAIEAERALEAAWREAQDERAAIVDERHAFQMLGLHAKRQAIEAAHVEALELDKALEGTATITTPATLHAVRSKHDVLASPAPRKPRTAYKARKTVVKLVGMANGVATYRISLNNGRVYLYTEGEEFAQVKLTGGANPYQTVTSQYTLARLRQAVADR